MRAIDMDVNTPYRVVTNSSDGTIAIGDIVWLSSNGHLNDANETAFLLEEEWKSSETVDFEVEEATEYYIEKQRWSEGLRKR